jgi:hypothetical protein
MLLVGHPLVRNAIRIELARGFIQLHWCVTDNECDMPHAVDAFVGACSAARLPNEELFAFVDMKAQTIGVVRC